MSMSTCFDPLAFPFQRAQTYVDANPPEVLSDEFYNPAQDALARLFGGIAGYSTSITSEEFILPVALHTPTLFDPFGQELAVTNQPGGYEFASVNVPGPGMFGVYHIDGTMSGNRGGGTDGFSANDANRNVGTMRWLFAVRVRCSTFATVSTSPPGIVFGLGPINDGHQVLPSWLADGTGFWTTWWDTGSTVTAIPTVDDQWITLWVGMKDADGVVRWYVQRDADPLPLLVDTQTLGTAAIDRAKRYFRYLVKNTAAQADYLEIDSIGMICER